MSQSNAPVSTSSTLQRKEEKARLLPVCFGELFNAANELALATTATCRTIRKTAEGMERAVTGIDQVATLMLEQQRQRLIADNTPA